MSTSFHFAYAIQSTKIFSSGCCSPTLSCHRQLNLFPEFLHISHLENGSFEVLSLQIVPHGGPKYDAKNNGAIENASKMIERIFRRPREPVES